MAKDTKCGFPCVGSQPCANNGVSDVVLPRCSGTVSIGKSFHDNNVQVEAGRLPFWVIWHVINRFATITEPSWRLSAARKLQRGCRG